MPVFYIFVFKIRKKIMTEIHSFTNFLQDSISPIVLISGVGLLLLSLTNRLGRTIDRSRVLVDALQKGDHLDKESKSLQLQILYKRSRILKSSITSVAFSILCSSLLIPVIFVMNLYDTNLNALGVILFLLSVVGIIFSAVFLFLDVTLTLKALNHEVKDYL